MSVSMALVGNNRVFWRPKDLGSSALVVWLDADDATTFTYSSGAIVSQWNDKSGNSRNATQATTARQPERITNGQNSRAVVRFSSHRLSLSATGITQEPYHYFIAYKQTSGNNGGTQRILDGRNSGNERGALASLNDPAYSLYSGQTNLRRGTPDTNWHVLYAVGNGSSSSLWLDGAQLGTTANPGTGYPTSVSIAAFNGSDIQYLGGDIGEILMIDGTLSTANRQRAEGYLAHRWGLTGNLPSDHPYKTVLP